ncbi:astacin-like [Hylaeus anthracinus]|uniref:astacin-like n=1 Tax=Hylaeus anthracinus TaxID=313031 RepID=UPI0023B9D067|nr:astacin-like [Hylaeus anthracinus]XP_054009363.1 astacin-like [Hylaeus anthracinus]
MKGTSDRRNVVYAWVTLLVLMMGIGTNSSAIHGDRKRVVVPPKPKFQGTFHETHQHETIATGGTRRPLGHIIVSHHHVLNNISFIYLQTANRIKSWSKKETQNLWELSGLYEGDIMLAGETDETRNGLVKTAARWPGGIVPYYIKEEDFDEEDVEVIEGAIKEYHENTCLRFRRYKKTDDDYITVEGKMSGCWSLVGRHNKGQVVNLQNPGCVQHGVVVHEFMHALGFYHQQSAADRDEWVTIHWTNVKPGELSNPWETDKERFFA